MTSARSAIPPAAFAGPRDPPRRRRSARTEISESDRETNPDPSRNGEFVSSRTSQFWATACIHVPTLDVQAPNQSRRKSRYSKALKTRLSTVLRVTEAASGGDQVQVVAVEVGKEARRLPWFSNGSPTKFTFFARRSCEGLRRNCLHRPPDGGYPDPSTSVDHDRRAEGIISSIDPFFARTK